jgi:hypothetical protein
MTFSKNERTLSNVSHRLLDKALIGVRLAAIEPELSRYPNYYATSRFHHPYRSLPGAVDRLDTLSIRNRLSVR